MAPVLDQRTWRFLIVAAVLLVVANLAFWGYRAADTSDQSETAETPSEVESVTPAPGSLADRRTIVRADLRDDLTGVLVIDGLRIPEDQLDPISQGIVTFRPGPDQEIEEFDAGLHTAQVLYWPADDPEPDNPGTFAWDFVASA